jgi:hypothetical protein
MHPLHAASEASEPLLLREAISSGAGASAQATMCGGETAGMDEISCRWEQNPRFIAEICIF